MQRSLLLNKFKAHAYRVWPLHLFRVEGDSMRPTYVPGDTLLGLSWFKPQVGQTIVAEHAGMPLIKRLNGVTDSQIWVIGDNPGHSTDSRMFGPLTKNALKAKIIAKL